MDNLIRINTTSEKALYELNQEIIKCNLCPRLSNYIKQLGQSKVKRFINEDYWAKPLPSFGDTKAQLLIIGLAPAATGVTEQVECLQEIAPANGLHEPYLKPVLRICQPVSTKMMGSY